MVKTLIGCCLIHLCIGSIYAISVLYPMILEITGWDTTTLVQGFSLTILTLGLSASFHQKLLSGEKKLLVLKYAIIFWMILQFSEIGIIYCLPSDPWYLIACGILGVSIGLLYVITINIVSQAGFKRVGLANGLVVFCFGLGSFISSKLFHTVPLPYIYGCYTLIMLFGLYLINPTSKIESPKKFSRDPKWYGLAIMFCCNIGIGISLLSNLTNLSIGRGISLEDAVTLVAICGLANSGGRLVYSFLSDFVGKLNMVILIMILQSLALWTILQMGFWDIPILIIISVYGGLFSIMPSLMKELYEDQGTIAYSQILSMWGVAGLIFPPLFIIFGFSMLMLLAMITIMIPIFVQFGC